MFDDLERITYADVQEGHMVGVGADWFTVRDARADPQNADVHILSLSRRTRYQNEICISLSGLGTTGITVRKNRYV